MKHCRLYPFVRELPVVDLANEMSDTFLHELQKISGLRVICNESAVATLSSSPVSKYPAKVGVFCAEVVASGRFFRAMHLVVERTEVRQNSHPGAISFQRLV